MKQIEKIATTATPDGGEMVLYRRDQDFAIRVGMQELMNSRQHESELELARLGCAHAARLEAPRILVGGLGMGYTLRQTLDMLGPQASVVASELLEDVTAWNRDYLAELNGRPLDDPRVEIHHGDVVELIAGAPQSFDAILLDIDNGPGAVTDAGNDRLYGPAGIRNCRQALRDQGCLAIWSIDPSKRFERMVMTCGLQIRRYRAPAYPGSKARSRFIWVASEKLSRLPPGGGEPRRPDHRGTRDRHRRPAISRSKRNW